VQRKVFRIEAMMAKRPVAPRVHAPAHDQHLARGGDDNLQNVAAELKLIRETLGRHKRDLAGLIGDSNERHMARAADELGAAVDGMETATLKILKSVEIIDDSAKALTASLKDDFKRGLAQDIQDNVMRIYESCNFQDIAGQRIGKVVATLTAIEEQVADMLARCNGIAAAPSQSRTALPAERNLINGPKLDGDAGHACQRDIDRLFG
jgi:chemotaxis protein CheZ